MRLVIAAILTVIAMAIILCIMIVKCRKDRSSGIESNYPSNKNYNYNEGWLKQPHNFITI